jgi:hypothetical protein
MTWRDDSTEYVPESLGQLNPSPTPEELDSTQLLSLGFALLAVAVVFCLIAKM